MSDQDEKRGVRRGMENLPDGYVTTAEVERLFGVSHKSNDRLFQALKKFRVQCLAVAGTPGQKVLGYIWNEVQILQQETAIREELYPPLETRAGVGLDWVALEKRLRKLEVGLSNLTRWASKHEEWHRAALGGPAAAEDVETLPLFGDDGGGSTRARGGEEGGSFSAGAAGASSDNGD